MFSTFHLVALEVKLQTTLGKSTFKSPKTLTSPVATGEGESPDESSALEELPMEVHFPIANRGKLDKLEDQLALPMLLEFYVYVIFYSNINNSLNKILIFFMSINDRLYINMICFDS